jgi:hypothetical protein
MVKLVDALQNWHIWTFSSCAGHENPAACQAPAGEWEVSLSLDRDEWGWKMLDWLTFISSALEDVEFHPWWNGPDDEVVAGGADFTLRGLGKTSADEFASWLTDSE